MFFFPPIHNMYETHLTQKYTEGHLKLLAPLKKHGVALKDSIGSVPAVAVVLQLGEASREAFPPLQEEAALGQGTVFSLTPSVLVLSKYA